MVFLEQPCHTRVFSKLLRQADFLLLIVIDAPDKKVSMLQIDRDTITDVETLGVLGNVIGTRKLQIALSHSYGKTPQDNCAYTVKTVSNLLQGEPLALTKPGQATRRLAEDLLREAETPASPVQESLHIETLYRYAQKGIATAIVPLTTDMEDQDRENGLICRIPKSYRAAAICGCIAVLPELDRLIPREVYSVIREKVLNTSYLRLG